MNRGLQKVQFGMDFVMTTKLKVTSIQTCPVRRGVSAATFDATGLGDRTGHVCNEMNEEY
jgi:hypothetical protein